MRNTGVLIGHALACPTASRGASSAHLDKLKHVLQGRRSRFRPWSSKRLSDREEILKMAHVLHVALVGRAGGRRAGFRAGVDQLLQRSIEAVKVGRIDAVCQIDAQRPNGGAIAESETDGVFHVIKILQVVLVHAERE